MSLGENDEVAAVGGRLLVINENSSALERIQCCEYMKTFQIARRIFAKLNAQCLIKHQNMIANPRYGMLGLATMSYQLVVELLGPVFWVVYACLLMWEKSFPFLSMAFAGYVVAQFGLTVISAYIDINKNMRRLLKWLPKLILATIEEMLLQILINVARSIGMITFYWRRLVW